MVETGKSINRFTWQHAAVLLMGLLVFVLLLLADKTNLDDETGSALGGRAGDGGKTESTVDGEPRTGVRKDLISLLPADESPAEIAQLRTALEAEQNAEQRVQLYHQIVEGYQNAGRTDLAAVYASALAEEVPDAKNFVVAGALFRNSAGLPFAQADSNLFRRLSQEAIRHDESALELEPQNEDAKLELGLAMVESGIYGMQGILKIREVADQNPNNTEALFHLGKYSLDTRQNDNAAKRFKQILAVQPNDVRAKYYLGLTEQRLGNSAEFNRLMSEVAVQTQDPNLAAMAKEALNKNL
jgi:outer membrane protein